MRKELIRRIGNSSVDTNETPIQIEGVRKVLICRPNHRLGNQLLITPLVQEVSEVFPNAKIDLFVKGGLAPVIFQNYTNVDRIIQLPKKHFKDIFKYLKGWASLKKFRYDIVVNVEKGSSSGNLSTQFARSDYRFFGGDQENLQEKSSDYMHVAKKPVYDLRNYLSQLGLTNLNKKIPELDLKLSDTELCRGRKKVEELNEIKGSTICIFTYATRNKCYSEEWWLDFYGKLKGRFSKFNIIEVLPVENVSRIGFREPSFYSKEIRDIGAVIANTDIFIGADSGIMHLASSVKTPSVGLFSVTNLIKYAPYGNNSLAVNTNENSSSEIIGIVESILDRTLEGK